MRQFTNVPEVQTTLVVNKLSFTAFLNKEIKVTSTIINKSE